MEYLDLEISVQNTSTARFVIIDITKTSAKEMAAFPLIAQIQAQVAELRQVPLVLAKLNPGSGRLVFEGPDEYKAFAYAHQAEIAFQTVRLPVQSL
jgi:hypothetical protein